RVDLQRHRFREHLLRRGQQPGVHQQVAPVELQHPERAGIELPELCLRHVDALDLAAVLEVAGDLRVRVVEHLALDHGGELRARLAAAACLLLLLLLGGDALVLFLLRADRVGLGPVDLAAAGATPPGLRRRLATLSPGLARGRARARVRQVDLAAAAGPPPGLRWRLATLSPGVARGRPRPAPRGSLAGAVIAPFRRLAGTRAPAPPLVGPGPRCFLEAQPKQLL